MIDAELPADYGKNGKPTSTRVGIRFSKKAMPMPAPAPPATNGLPAARAMGEVRTLVTEVLKGGPDIGLTFAEIFSRVKARPHRTPSSSIEKAVRNALYVMKSSRQVEHNGINWRLREAATKG